MAELEAMKLHDLFIYQNSDPRDVRVAQFVVGNWARSAGRTGRFKSMRHEDKLFIIRVAV